MNEFRYGALEFRETDDGLGVVVGTVIRYGDVATLPWGTEEFKLPVRLQGDTPAST